MYLLAKARRLPFRRAKYTIIMRKIHQSPLFNDKNSFRKSVYKTITVQISAVRTGAYVRIWMLCSWILYLVDQPRLDPVH